ncbi:hypothetical protein [Maridesulfovibrio zosterae]|uniref:hypothetical protein n=1 Tax=Maridesulfovibrio zosterae TaxID=82171 RepID=UPI00040E7BAE|nr:hypothetical protein [Maridesulfovibrio zosterae]
MGSPSAELNVLESARPWYQNGLQFIFKEALPEITQLENAGSLQKRNLPTATSRTRDVGGSSQQQGRTGQPSVSVEPKSSFHQPTPAAKPSRIPPRSKPSQNQERCIPDASSWPAPWSTIASRVTSRLQIFWTYSQLGQDLSGQADAERRKLFQSLIGYMGLPKGAISFWPCTTWDGNTFENRADIFWKGVKDYDVKFVACFGDQTRSIIANEAPANAASAHVNDVQIVMLQDPDFLKTLPAEEQQLLCISLLRLPLF